MRCTISKCILSFLLLLTATAHAAVSIVNGPMLGHVSDTSARIWLQLDTSATVTVKVFNQRNYQASANSYRDALRGDGDPRWTEVWSHVQLGKIFDITGQRERATNEYRQALQTNDNTQGALDEARKYMQKAYEPGKSATAPGN